MTKKRSQPKLLFILSMAIFGTLAPFTRHIGVSSGELALYRAVLAAVLIGLFLLVTKQRFPLGAIKKALPLLLLSGFAMGFNWIFLFEAYKYTTVPVATLSYYFAPVIVTVACPLLFREKLGLRQWLCFIASTVGLALITGFGDLNAGSDHLWGVLLGLCAACLYAAVILLNKAIPQVTGLHRTFMQFLAAITVLVPYVALTGGVTLRSLDLTGWICLLTVGLVHSGLAYCMYFSSLKELPGQKVAILSYIDPLMAVLVSWLFLEEGLSPMQLLGGGLILGFTLFNELIPQKKNAEV